MYRFNYFDTPSPPQPLRNTPQQASELEPEPHYCLLFYEGVCFSLFNARGDLLEQGPVAPKLWEMVPRPSVQMGHMAVDPRRSVAQC